MKFSQFPKQNTSYNEFKGLYYPQFPEKQGELEKQEQYDYHENINNSFNQNKQFNIYSNLNKSDLGYEVNKSYQIEEPNWNEFNETNFSIIKDKDKYVNHEINNYSTYDKKISNNSIQSKKSFTYNPFDSDRKQDKNDKDSNSNYYSPFKKNSLYNIPEEDHSNKSMSENKNQIRRVIHVVGFSPENIMTVSQEFSKYGTIESYYYKNNSNWIIFKYSQALEAQNALNSKNSSNLKVFLTDNEYNFKPYCNESQNNSIGGNSYLSQGLKIPYKSHLNKFLDFFVTW